MPGFLIPQINQNCGGDSFDRESAYEGPSPNTEFGRKNRWKIEILRGQGFDSLSDILLFANKCTRPSPEIDEIQIHNGQDVIFRPGKHKFNPVEFSFYESTSESGDLSINNVAEKIYKWWAEDMIISGASRHGSLKSYLKNCQLTMLDGVGNQIWSYDLYQCWITKVTPSTLDYSDDSISEITVTMRYNLALESHRGN